MDESDLLSKSHQISQQRWSCSKILKTMAFKERPLWDEMFEGYLLSKFKQKKYPNKGILSKALSKHKLWSTKWTIQTKPPWRINNERANVLSLDLFWETFTKTQSSNKKNRPQVLRKSPKVTVWILITTNCL